MICTVKLRGTIIRVFLSHCVILIIIIIIIVGENDTRIINETTLIIDPQSDSACITIEAVDDQIAEETELFNLTAMANDTLDVVNGTTSIEIEDNDGMYAYNNNFDKIEKIWCFCRH